MAGRFFQWTPDDQPGFVIDADDRDAFRAELRGVYSPLRRSLPLERVLDIAADLKVRSVVVERRYIDLDFRSEHTHFYSTTFSRYPSVCHRLHFFSEPVKPDLSNLGSLGAAYRGYAVMRPVLNAPVGRTMIPPPPDLAGATLCLATDTVHLWGHTFSVSAMPFVSQDTQFLRCAHSSLWMMLYHAYLRHGLPRRLPNDIQKAATGGNVIGRQLPSDGLTPGQVLQALHQLNMSGAHLRLPSNRSESKANHRLALFATMCRYVNSQMPPMVYSGRHAWVIVGYKKIGKGPAHDHIQLFRHDDARGPYLKVDTPWDEDGHELPVYLPWKAAIPPLPQKLYMTSERAEAVGESRLRNLAKQIRGGSNLLQETINQGRMTLRTYAVRSHEFKNGLKGRVPSQVVALYQLAHWPRWVWVVEALDRDLDDAGKDAVLGEIVIDTTASDLSYWNDPVVLSRNVAGEVRLYTPDHGDVYNETVTNFAPYGSGLIRLDGQFL